MAPGRIDLTASRALVLQRMTGGRNMVKRILLTLLLLVSGATLSRAGDIVGQVHFFSDSGNPAQPLSPFAQRRQVEHQHHGDQQPTEKRVVAVAYLADHDGLPAGAPPAEYPIVDQRNMRIIPHISAIQVGTTVEFPNSDDLYHNLFSLSKAKKFDLGRYGQGVSKTVTFDQVGEVQVFCDIHPHMNAIILVLPNPYFAEVHAGEVFRIENVPAGDYRLELWHESAEVPAKSNTVPETGSVEVTFNVSAR